MTNIHACLVHEEPECVADLVANLRHFDPESVVLLYDGSEGQRLTRSGAIVEQRGVRMHPAPRPMVWGRLHGFAFDCLRFAVDTMDFSSMTIVDSDQLLVRAGYANALADHLRRHRDIGCLVSSDGGTQPRDTRSALASMAWREFDLWRPFLRRFALGERYWPTWTFWPGTVFTREAAADVVELAQDPQLTALLARTRLWATEELVLPTLVALRGHRVAPTPFRDDLVRFRVNWTVDQLSASVQYPDLFWVHPVPRRVDDSVRRWLRSRAGSYPPAPGSAGRVARPALLQPMRVLRAMEAVDGRLTATDGDLLMGAALHALATTPAPHVIVEVGSSSGRSALVLNSVARAVTPPANVVAIDPRTTESEWGGPVAMLVLDSQLDFASVAADYSHVEAELSPGAVVAFTGFVPGCQGIVDFVDHLVTTGVLEWICCADSLAVTRFVRPVGIASLHSVLDEMDAIDGWLSRDEAAYLGLLTAECVRLAPKASVVEVGSYCGRGTVVLARASTATPRGRVHAVDTFDGVVGSATTGLFHGEPTWDRFRSMIGRAGLRRRVQPFRGRSRDVAWQGPVSLLVVDGWHDYESVRADVDRFAPGVVVGGMVAFHDHADYAPDVSRVFGELVRTGSWERVGQVGTLAVLRRGREPDQARVVATATTEPVAKTPARPPPALVSCLMPTRDRPAFVRFALETFARQDYPARELIVVDDGDQPVEDLVAHDSRVVYLRPGHRLTIGAKRCLAADAARGQYLAHWDDDDWYSPDRLSTQLAVLTLGGHSVVGSSSLLYWEPAAQRAWRYTHQHPDAGSWAHDATLLLARSAWEERPYPDLNHGLDVRWLASLPEDALMIDNSPIYVGLMHNGNTSRKNTSKPCWAQVPVEQVNALVGTARDAWLAAVGLVHDH
jgi:hypothetical protein